MKKILSLALVIVLTCTLFMYNLQIAGAANSSSVAGKVTTQSTNLNVRQKASTNSQVIKTLKNGTWITLISKSGNFWKVEYASGKYGYCHKNYIKERAASYAMYVNTKQGVLNVRKGKGTSYDIKATLSRGKCVVVLEKDSSWSKILYNGTSTGYVSSAYLSSEKPSSYSKITLNVPLYKQTDSKWKSIKIGTQGDTIGSSGCTTTCLAMSESFRKGTSVTPDKMAAKLSYSESGMLYWPTDYKTQLVSKTNYLDVIYSALKSGKPVIFGSKKSNGSQHWVVVTGYKAGSASLKASDFTINDPGASRTVLSEFISVYPVVYKVAYWS